MRGLFAGLILLAVVAGGLDLALTRAAERRASDQASALLDAPATVDLQGWPVSLRLLLGAVPVVVVQAENVPTDSGVRLESLGLTLSDVRVRLADLEGGRLPTDARDGAFTAALDRRGVGQLLGGLVAADAIQLRDGVVGVEVAGVLLEAEVDVDQRGRLVLTLVNAMVTASLRRRHGAEVVRAARPEGHAHDGRQVRSVDHHRLGPRAL